MKSVEGLIVVSRHILHSPDILQPGVLGTYAGVIQSRRNRVGLNNLPVLVLHKVGAITVQHPGTSR